MSAGNGGDAPRRIPGKDAPRPLPKRFFTTAEARPAADGFEVALDGKSIRTPGKRPLVVASHALADAIATEWRAQGDSIDPATMPLTRIVNSALDGVAQRRDEVAADVAAYAGSDLTCYRADQPPELVAEQTRLWDPILAWARAALGVEFTTARGVMPVAQPAAARDAVAAAIAGLDPVQLAALHVVTTLTGSALIALAVARGQLTPEQAWAAAHVDEDWQSRQWGVDSEAAERRRHRWQEMAAACRILGRAP